MDTAEEVASKVDALENQVRMLQVQLMMQADGDGGFMGEDLVSGGIMGDSDGYAQCFDIKSLDTETGAIVLENCFYAIGGRSYIAGTGTGYEMNATVEASKILCLKIGAGTTRTVQLECLSTLPDSTSVDSDYYRIPLYWFDENLSVKIDMRTMPTAAMIEFGS